MRGPRPAGVTEGAVGQPARGRRVMTRGRGASRARREANDTGGLRGAHFGLQGGAAAEGLTPKDGEEAGPDDGAAAEPRHWLPELDAHFFGNNLLSKALLIDLDKLRFSVRK